MNRLTIEDRAKILELLCEGVGINATSRLAKVSKNTVLKLLSAVGRACGLYQDRVLRNLSCKRIECDEIWSFVGAKEKNVVKGHPAGYGDCYTFTAIDVETKLMPSWLVGVRNRQCTFDFMADLAGRMAGRIQLTTDGWNSYPDAVEAAFKGKIDYAVLNKSYKGDPSSVEGRRRYSQPEIVTFTKELVNGAPDMRKASTSIVERSNLSLRMGNRRFTRLTNGFSKKLENHMHVVNLYFMHYNFCKIHQALRVTPAMEASIDDHVWGLEEVVMMADTNG